MTFQKSSDDFGPIDANLNDDDLQRLRELIVIVALRVTLAGNTNGYVSGFILPNTVYKDNNGGKSFDFIRKSRARYDPAIEKINKYYRNKNMRGLKFIWKSETDN